MRVILYYLLLGLLVLIAFWRGKEDERLAAIICVAGTTLTVVAGDQLRVHSSSFHAMAFLVDFVVFLAIALKSTRFWPIWVAGLQLTATTIHPMMAVTPDLPGKVFGAALAFWSYPILFLIGIGAWRTQLIERWRNGDEIATREAIS